MWNSTAPELCMAGSSHHSNMPFSEALPHHAIWCCPLLHWFFFFLQHPIVFISFSKMIFLIHLCTCLMSSSPQNQLPEGKQSCITFSPVYPWYLRQELVESTGSVMGLGPPQFQQSGSPHLSHQPSSQIHVTPRAREVIPRVFLHLPHPLPILDRTSFSPGHCSPL